MHALSIILALSLFVTASAINCQTCDSFLSCQNPLTEYCPPTTHCYTVYEAGQVVNKGCALNCHSLNLAPNRICQICSSENCNVANVYTNVQIGSSQPNNNCDDTLEGCLPKPHHIVEYDIGGYPIRKDIYETLVGGDWERVRHHRREIGRGVRKSHQIGSGVGGARPQIGTGVRTGGSEIEVPVQEDPDVEQAPALEGKGIGGVGAIGSKRRRAIGNGVQGGGIGTGVGMSPNQGLGAGVFVEEKKHPNRPKDVNERSIGSGVEVSSHHKIGQGVNAQEVPHVEPAPSLEGKGIGGMGGIGSKRSIGDGVQPEAGKIGSGVQLPAEKVIGQGVFVEDWKPEEHTNKGIGHGVGVEHKKHPIGSGVVGSHHKIGHGVSAASEVEVEVPRDPNVEEAPALTRVGQALPKEDQVVEAPALPREDQVEEAPKIERRGAVKRRRHAHRRKHVGEGVGVEEPKTSIDCGVDMSQGSIGSGVQGSSHGQGLGSASGDDLTQPAGGLTSVQEIRTKYGTGEGDLTQPAGGVLASETVVSEDAPTRDIGSGVGLKRRSIGQGVRVNAPKVGGIVHIPANHRGGVDPYNNHGSNNQHHHHRNEHGHHGRRNRQTHPYNNDQNYGIGHGAQYQPRPIGSGVQPGYQQPYPQQQQQPYQQQQYPHQHRHYNDGGHVPIGGGVRPNNGELNRIFWSVPVTIITFFLFH